MNRKMKSCEDHKSESVEKIGGGPKLWIGHAAAVSEYSKALSYS